MTKLRGAARILIVHCTTIAGGDGMAKRRKAPAAANGTVGYRAAMLALQIELVKLQRSIIGDHRKILVILEGRDAPGNHGTIISLIHHPNPLHTPPAPHR